MSVDKSTVVRIAQLARLHVPEGDIDKLATEMGKILDWVAQLNAVDTEGVQPMTSVADMILRQRDDQVNDGDCAEDVLANAPETHDGYFLAPKVIE